MKTKYTETHLIFTRFQYLNLSPQTVQPVNKTNHGVTTGWIIGNSPPYKLLDEPEGRRVAAVVRRRGRSRSSQAPSPWRARAPVSGAALGMRGGGSLWNSAGWGLPARAGGAGRGGAGCVWKAGGGRRKSCAESEASPTKATVRVGLFLSFFYFKCPGRGGVSPPC